LFKAWLAAQKNANVFTLSDVSKGEKEEEEDKKSNIKKVEIEPEEYTKLAPNPKNIKKAAAEYDGATWDNLLTRKLAASTNFDDFYMIDEAKSIRYVFKADDGNWYIWNRKLSKNNQVLTFKDDLKTVSDEGNFTEKETELKSDLEKSEKTPDEIEPEKKEEPTKEPEKTPDKEPEESPEKKAIKQLASKKQMQKAFGELAFALQQDMATEPTQLPKDNKVKNGWRFELKNKGVVFLYQKPNGKFYVGFDTKAKPIVDKLDISTEYGLKIKTPE